MSRRDLVNSITVEESLNPAARTAAAQGTGVDLTGYDSAVFVMRFGAVADGYFTFVLEESDTLGSGYTTVAAGDLDGSPISAFGESPDAGVNTAGYVGYQGDKQFIRVAIIQGLSPAPQTGAICGGDVIRGHAHQRPTA